LLIENKTEIENITGAADLYKFVKNDKKNKESENITEEITGASDLYTFVKNDKNKKSIENETNLTVPENITENITLPENITIPVIPENISEEPENISEENQTSEEIVELVNTSTVKKIEITNNPEFNLTFLDTDNNSLIDKIYWQTDLSNKSFSVEVDLTIINVQSYPTVGGKWTVAFTTTGIADLTITAVDGTTFTEIPDNTNTVNDLEFLELKCGNNTLENFFLVDSNGNLIPYKVYKIKRRIEEIKKKLIELEEEK